MAAPVTGRLPRSRDPPYVEMLPPVAAVGAEPRVMADPVLDPPMPL